jgi:hypothetical protein
MCSYPSLLEQITKDQNIGTQVGSCEMSEFWTFIEVHKHQDCCISNDHLFQVL